MYAIRQFIKTQYDCELTKRTVNAIKKFIGAEFAAGRIKMTNDDGDEIKFNKRFATVKWTAINT